MRKTAHIVAPFIFTTSRRLKTTRQVSRGRRDLVYDNKDDSSKELDVEEILQYCIVFS